MKVNYIFCLMAFAAMLPACSKTEPAPESSTASGEPILFAVSDDIALKSIVEDASDLVSKANVYVYGTKDGGDIKDTVKTSPAVVVSNYAGTKLTYDSSTSLWNVETGGVWTYNKTADRGYLYNFSAYAVSGSESEIKVTTNSANNFGKSFTVTQPSTYEGSEFIDYLLSNVYSVTTTKNSAGNARGEVVRLHMEHAMAAVRVKVKCDDELYRVGIRGIEIKNFYRGATMVCNSQAAYGTGSTNKWSTTVPTNFGNSYSYGDVTSSSKNFTDAKKELGTNTGVYEYNLMDFIAVPQDAASAVLTISYIVQETSTASIHEGTSYWDLSNYSGWDYGYRNTYTITIDTSNHLNSTIDDWDEGNSITGIILP